MSSDETPSPSLPEIVGAPGGAQLTDVEQRLAALEKKAPSSGETRFLRFGAMAGVLGTLISIMNGGLTVYSGTVRQTHEDKQKLWHEFSGYIQNLSDVDQRLFIIVSSDSDQSTKYAQGAAATSDGYIAAIAAEQLLPRIEGLVTSSQFALLGEAKARSGDFKAARRYLDRAVSLSDGLLAHAEALRFSAGVLAASSDPADQSFALGAYSSAFDIVSDNNYLGASGAKAYIVQNWIIAEAYIGDCMKAASLISRYVELLSNHDVKSDFRTVSKKNLYDSLVQNTRCRLDLSKLES